MHTSTPPFMFSAQKFNHLAAGEPAAPFCPKFYCARFSPLSLGITVVVVGVQTLLTILHFL